MEKIKDIKTNLNELKAEKERNFRERLKFIDFWANYIKQNKDGKWSRQQIF